MERYYIQVELEPAQHRDLTQQRIETITARVREFWPLTALVPRAGAVGGTRTNVVGGFAGPAEAMFVLGVVMNAFEVAGVPVAFRHLSIGAILHDKPLTVDELARND